MKYKWYLFAFSGTLFVASIVLMATYGFKAGIDFTGGTLIELSFRDTRPTSADIGKIVAPLHLGSVVIQPSGNKNVVLRLRYITPEEHDLILSTFRGAAGASKNQDQKIATQTVSEASVETIGPAVSTTLKTRAFNAGIGVIVAIIAFIAYAFRKVSKPVASWRYGVAAVIAPIHTVVITSGVFSLLGRFTNFEADIPFVVALMTAFGYSVHDTIVVFDRIREMLLRHRGEKFSDVVNFGVQQTYVRSINTSLTVLLVLLAMFLFGGTGIHYFALALLVGIFFGTYSSIFVASALLAAWADWREKRRA